MKSFPAIIRVFRLFLLLCTFNYVDWVTAEDDINTQQAQATEQQTEQEEGPQTIVSVQIPLPAKDKGDSCTKWASEGECEANPGYMLSECSKSCGQQSNPAAAFVQDGEDHAIGAFRFAEDNQLSEGTNEIIELILETARSLQSKLSESTSGYETPTDLTHCGSGNNKKPKPCSAGKLWKRAEEMRKADMYDAAGADLIRALLKSGIEIDFKERCYKSLGWALSSVQRQRQREQREAEEEAKLEERREQERLAMEEAQQRKEEYEKDFVKFGTQLQTALQSEEEECDNPEQPPQETVANADGSTTVEGTSPEIKKLIRQIKESYVQEGPQGGNYSETIQLLKKIPPSDKSVDILLIEARCHEMLGNHKNALSAAGKLVQKAANYDPWINDSPRMMAATLGANAAMQLGLSENALSFYQTVLKFDPEQPRARKQYRGLKKVVKLMGKAEEQIQKGYNKAASVHVDDCLTAMRGLDVDSPLFRSKIQLKQCTILSGMGKYEEALNNCDTAVELRLSNDNVLAASRKEALLTRAEALLLDMDYDEAVSDFRAAFDLVPDDDETGEKRELHQKLQQTMHQQEMWNGGKKDYRFNENTGYPDGMPPQRDHAKILQLPIDLDQREKSVKCAWLKKQFKILVKKYHPDKYKGNKKRAARKFKEVKEAKEIISSQWQC